MYEVDERDAVRELTDVTQSSVGAPIPVVLGDEHRLLLAFFMAALLAVCVHVLITETRLAIAGVVVLAIGWPLFALARRVTRQ